jgi:N-hydroxyarylamine O-acetyltransferase
VHDWLAHVAFPSFDSSASIAGRLRMGFYQPRRVSVKGIDIAIRDHLLQRIGLDAAPSADSAGLRAVHRAYVSHVPFEDLAVQLGESAPLDPDALVDRVLTGGRGGYCFEVNTVFALLLESLGFEVERREAIVGPRDAHASGEPTNHLALVVRTPAGESFIAEGGWGEGPLEPLPLAEGVVTLGPFSFGIERDGDGWWVEQHEHGSSPGFRFADAPATLADFQPHHERTSTAPDSAFVQTLLVQQPYDDKIVSLRSRTLFADGPGLRERELLDDEDVFATALNDRFGIDPAVLGPERISRLWARAEQQHAARAKRG